MPQEDVLDVILQSRDHYPAKTELVLVLRTHAAAAGLNLDDTAFADMLPQARRRILAQWRKTALVKAHAGVITSIEEAPEVQPITPGQNYRSRSRAQASPSATPTSSTAKTTMPQQVAPVDLSHAFDFA